MSAKLRIPALLGALLAAALGCEAREGASDPAAARLDAGLDEVRLDPGPYRENLMAFEAILYRAGPPEAQDYERLAVMLSRVTNQIAVDHASPSARRKGGRLLHFSAQLDAHGVDGYTRAARSVIRSDWEELRGEIFAPVAWFGSARAASAARPAALSPEARALDAILVELEGEVDRAKGELVALGGDDPITQELAAGGVEPQKRLKQWSRSWDRRFRHTLDRVPERPGPGADVDLVLAHQSLDLARTQLADLDEVGRRWTPDARPKLQLQLTTAAFALAQARRLLRESS